MRVIRSYLAERVREAVRSCQQAGFLPEGELSFRIEPPKRPEHGDFALSAALAWAKAARRPPREIAEALVARIEDPRGWIASTDVAGPGFVNFRLSRKVWWEGLGRILAAGRDWGRGQERTAPRILLEFVSANPTGPLHVGHGRGAAVGDALARILRFAGYPVSTEYYLNDAGRQVENLGLSVWIRALEVLKSERKELDPEGRGFEWLEVPELPEDGYRGDYVWDLARRAVERHGGGLARAPREQVVEDLAREAVQVLTERIRKTLETFSVTFDSWFSERRLHESGAIERAVAALEERGHVYEKDGAKWFRSTEFGDEKDRVLVRADGRPTYFAADVAYHLDKFERGFDHLIDLWGADHHGYVARVRAAVEALGREPDAFEALLVQFVTLRRGGEKVSMGKRAGTFVTVEDLVREVGTDVARYFFLERRHDSHIDFDLEVAASQDPTVNPAVYVQYGHARACSILRKASEELQLDPPDFRLELAERLEHEQEILAIKRMLDLPDLVAEAAETRQPHRIVAYLLELSRIFQSYYTQTKTDPILPPTSRRVSGLAGWDWEKTKARLLWVRALRDVFATCLGLLGLSAPERMASLEESPADSGGEP